MKKLSFSGFAEHWMKDKNCLFISQAVTFKEYQQQIYDAYQSYLSEADQPVLPERWEDLKEVSGHIIDEDSSVEKRNSFPCNPYHRNIFRTEAQAKSALAMAQLSQLMKAYNGDWEADWKNREQVKHCILCFGDEFAVDGWRTRRHFLAFKDHDTASLFLKRFEGLIKEYYMMD